MDPEEKVIGLPETVCEIPLADKKVFLVGTAHISKESINDVRATVEAVRPDTIAVELCESRYRSLKNPDRWKKTDVFKIVREGRSLFLLIQLVMGAFYKKIGEQLGVTPGADMLEGVRLAEETGSRLELIDRDVQVTLKRLWGFLSFWKKTKLVFKMLLGFLEPEEIDVSVVENLKKKDQLEILMEQFGQDLPEIKERLIDERDVYLAQKIRAAPGKTLVAVVGAGHVPGIVREIQKVSPLAPLETVPPPSKIIRGIKWAIPAAIVLLILSGFFLGQSEKSIESIYLWILVNGILSALGVLLALGHPLTVLSAFIAAPLTSLNPMVAAGWVSGLVQAWIKKPTVSDFEALPGDIFSFKGFWTNPVSRIILVVAFANLGSSIGTFVAGSWIATKMI